MIAENAGLNATEVIGQLKAAHAQGEQEAGLDIESGGPRDLSELGIVDLYNAKVTLKSLCHHNPRHPESHSKLGS